MDTWIVRSELTQTPCVLRRESGILRWSLPEMGNVGHFGGCFPRASLSAVDEETGHSHRLSSPHQNLPGDRFSPSRDMKKIFCNLP